MAQTFVSKVTKFCRHLQKAAVGLPARHLCTVYTARARRYGIGSRPRTGLPTSVNHIAHGRGPCGSRSWAILRYSVNDAANRRGQF